MMWVRWTLPRLRIDQVMMTCLKYLLPISCVLLLGVGLWQVLVAPEVGPYFSWVLAGLCALLLVWMVYKLFTTPSRLPFAGVPPPWERPPARAGMAAR
jgi:NADH-quinone oxidoreductase subunit H